MTLRSMRHVPVGLLLGLLTWLTWSDVDPAPVRVSDRVDGLRSITWAGAISPDGRLAVRITYDLGDDQQRQLSVRLPDGARYFAVDDVPTEASSGVYATVPVAGVATVSYELPGAVTRYRDGAVLAMVRVKDGSLDGDGALFPCPRCYLDPSGYGDVPLAGSLSVPGAESVRLSFVQLTSIRSAASPTEVRFAGIDRTGETVALLATLPSEAVPNLPVRDGTVAKAVTATTAQIRDAGETLHRPGIPAHGSRPGAILMTALLGAMVAWIVLRAVWSKGARAAERAAGTPDPITGMRAVPPDQLEPALVGAVVGKSVRGDRSVVAATLVELARRGVISFSGNDDRRFTVTVPAGAIGESPFEQAVLSRLRGKQPDASTVEPLVLVAPPLWGTDGAAVAKRLWRVLLRESMRQKLTRVSPPAALLVPLTLAIGVLGIRGSVGGAVFAWIVTIVGGLIAIGLASSRLVVLTRRGRAEQAEWADYASWLHSDASNAHLADADPWDVATVGEPLAYAAALGAAPRVARLLSPRPEVQR